VKLHWVVLTGVTLLLMLGVATAPAAAQESACDAVIDNATNATTGPGGELSDAIGEQGSDIGNELSDRWLDARLDNATSDAERAGVLGTVTDRIEARLNLTETCLWGERMPEEVDPKVRELTPRQVDALEQQTQSLHRRLNDTRNHSASLPGDLRAQQDIGRERLSALERRIVRVRESLPPGSEDSEN
jgi:hypothetical protein